MRLWTERAIPLARAATGIALALLLAWEARSQAPGESAQTSQQPSTGGQSAANDGQSSKEKPKLGVLLNDPRAFPGYTLVAPMNSKKTYLIDLQGRVVRTWESKYAAGQSAYLLENGHLLRAARLDPQEQIFGGMASGGRVQEFTWDGELVWDFKLHNDKQLHHHDICAMPNGNVLFIVWEIKTEEELVAAGRNPETTHSPWLSDSIIEIKPTGKTTGEVVWEWHAWDHLIQDHDATKAHYGDVAKHPELIDVNFGAEPGAPFQGFGRMARRDQRKENAKEKEATKAELDRLRGLGYVGGAPAARKNLGMIPDWHHVNAVAYNAELDQIMVSLRLFSEIWIIDHSTTTAEAASHKGGRSGKGGDLLYRWGNPRAYRAGTKDDQKLFYQHDAHWIPRGRPGEGHVIVFNNGDDRTHQFSSVDEIVLPVDSQGHYQRDPNAAFGPREAVWSYTAPKKEDFFSAIMSGANRLPNGNTLVCSSMNGTIFEVTPDKEIVWKYVNPDRGAASFGGPGFGRRGAPGANRGGGTTTLADVLPPMLRFALELKPEQRNQLDDLQKDAVKRLETILDEGQKKQLRESRSRDSFGFGSLSTAGQLVPLATQITLKLTAEQKKQLSAVQKEVDTKLDQVLDANQKQRMKEMQQMSTRGGPPGFGRGGPPGFGGPAGGQPVFRAYRYGPEYPGLVGKDLTPGKTVEELQSKEPPKAAAR